MDFNLPHQTTVASSRANEGAVLNALPDDVDSHRWLGEAPEVDLTRHVGGGEEGAVVVQGNGV